MAEKKKRKDMTAEERQAHDEMVAERVEATSAMVGKGAKKVGRFFLGATIITLGMCKKIMKTKY